MTCLIAKGYQVELELHNFFKLLSFPKVWARLQEEWQEMVFLFLANSAGEPVVERLLLAKFLWTLEVDRKDKILSQEHTRP